MSRHLFGWDLPPGCTMRDIENAAGGEGPCAVCGQGLDNCICPECNTCGCIGDPACYERHGLVRTPEQIKLLAEAEARWAAEEDSMARYFEETKDG